jgi:zinc transporter ZupT
MNRDFKLMVSGICLIVGMLISIITIMDLIEAGFKAYGFSCLGGLILIIISRIIDSEANSSKTYSATKDGKE